VGLKIPLPGYRLIMHMEAGIHGGCMLFKHGWTTRTTIRLTLCKTTRIWPILDDSELCLRIIVRESV
jgi:hypothetical protein